MVFKHNILYNIPAACRGMHSSHPLADDQKRTMNILADLSSSDEADQRLPGTATSSSTALASSTNDKTIIDFASLDISALEKYQHAFRVKTKRIRPTMPELTRAITDHYRQANLVDGEETEQELLTRFVWRVRGDSRYTVALS
ncbi:hypothetical protein BC937DRAFT_92065 [Endogone sp. FLAS-F59071]|nr:hypothetical protein BC937DRAFT_92065 [Endogone sp. FLAS-F59071]|eukprot:RUS23132.1 hypothetical protein BC937DRAFT_92065 [Endogone sp. FLAS-F59071]